MLKVNHLHCVYEILTSKSEERIVNDYKFPINITSKLVIFTSTPRNEMD